MSDEWCVIKPASRHFECPGSGPFEVKPTMKLRPLSDRVIVKQSEAETKTASGIVLPDSAKEKPTRGKVISVGPGKVDDHGKHMTLNVKAGDTVYYGKYSGTDIEVDGEKVVILRESDILGILQ